jgi:hypothetical protein
MGVISRGTLASKTVPKISIILIFDLDSIRPQRNKRNAGIIQFSTFSTRYTQKSESFAGNAVRGPVK